MNPYFLTTDLEDYHSSNAMNYTILTLECIILSIRGWYSSQFFGPFRAKVPSKQGEFGIGGRIRFLTEKKRWVTWILETHQKSSIQKLRLVKWFDSLSHIPSICAKSKGDLGGRCYLTNLSGCKFGQMMQMLILDYQQIRDSVSSYAQFTGQICITEEYLFHSWCEVLKTFAQSHRCLEVPSPKETTQQIAISSLLANMLK